MAMDDDFGDGWGAEPGQRIVRLGPGERARSRRAMGALGLVAAAAVCAAGAALGLRHLGDARARAEAAAAAERPHGHAGGSATGGAPPAAGAASSAAGVLPPQPFPGTNVIPSGGWVANILSGPPQDVPTAADQAATTASARAEGALSLAGAAAQLNAEVARAQPDPSAQALLFDTEGELQQGASSELLAAQDLLREAQQLLQTVQSDGPSAGGSGAGGRPSVAKIQADIGTAGTAIARAQGALAALPAPNGGGGA